MPPPLPPLPDLIPLREALRSVRHALRTTRTAMEGALPLQALPGEPARLARGALDASDNVARGLDRMASRVLRHVIGGAAPASASLQGFAGRGPAAAADFAAFCYVGLALILEQLRVGQAFISESAAREAWLRAVARCNDRELPRLAAALQVELRAGKVLRDLDPDAAGTLDSDELLPLPVFALLAWLLEGPQAGTGAAGALGESRVLDRVRLIADDIVAADSVRNEARLAQLFAQFQPRAG